MVLAADFSVIVPTFRRPKALSEALNSVLSQKGATIEVIVVDDCPDGSANEVAKAAGGCVRYFHNPRPTGGVPSVVRNLGWRHAEGRFIHFLDDDDLAPAGHYAAVKQVFQSRPEIGVVFGRIEPFGDCPADQLTQERRFFSDAAKRAASCARFGPKWAFAGQMLFDRTLVVCSACVVRRECVEALGGFDAEIRLMEDSDYFLRAMRQFDADPSRRVEQMRGRRRMQANYLKRRGAFEFLLLALFARTVLRVA
jgi:glycosyltransferase involved in cell wall biosynthesis